jgi:hypothetical protein
MKILMSDLVSLENQVKDKMSSNAWHIMREEISEDVNLKLDEQVLAETWTRIYDQIIRQINEQLYENKKN